MDIWQAQPWQEAVTYMGNAEWLLSAYAHPAATLSRRLQGQVSG